MNTNNHEKQQLELTPNSVKLRDEHGSLSPSVPLRRTPEGKLQFLHPGVIEVGTPEDLAHANLFARLEGAEEQGT